MICCADGFFGGVGEGGVLKLYKKIGLRKLVYTVLMGFLEGAV